MYPSTTPSQKQPTQKLPNERRFIINNKLNKSQ